MASMPHGASNLADVGDSVARGNKKMKDGAVVPDIVGARCELGLRDIGDQPANLAGGCS